MPPQPRLAAACPVWRYRPQPAGPPSQVVRQLEAHDLTVPAAPTQQEIAALVTAAGGAAEVPALVCPLPAARPAGG